MQQLAIQIPGKSAVGASLWQVEQACGVVLLHPATAVTQQFYQAFAVYLSGLGLHVLTYDYRGTGRSRPARMRDANASMADWMEDDVGAVTRWAGARFPGLPLLAIGHSVGGHAIALSSASSALRAGVMIASHAGVTRTIRGLAERARVWGVMRVLTPVLCAVYGYMPGRRLGLGEDLPAPLMRQWSRWSRLPRYFYDDPAMQASERAARVHLPLLVLGFDDDPWANPGAIDLLLEPLLNARIERRHIAPSAVGVPHIGHMGFFRQRCADALWPQVGSWLLRQCDTRVHPA